MIPVVDATMLKNGEVIHSSRGDPFVSSCWTKRRFKPFRAEQGHDWAEKEAISRDARPSLLDGGRIGAKEEMLVYPFSRSGSIQVPDDVRLFWLSCFFCAMSCPSQLRVAHFWNVEMGVEVGGDPFRPLVRLPSIRSYLVTPVRSLRDPFGLRRRTGPGAVGMVEMGQVEVASGSDAGGAWTIPFPYNGSEGGMSAGSFQAAPVASTRCHAKGARELKRVCNVPKVRMGEKSNRASFPFRACESMVFIVLYFVMYMYLSAPSSVVDRPMNTGIPYRKGFERRIVRVVMQCAHDLTQPCGFPRLDSSQGKQAQQSTAKQAVGNAR